MPYLESLEQAKQFGLDAARLMDQHDIALNPDNYMVWYEYVAGRSPELASALDVLIGNKVEFTEERNREIFTQFFGGGAGQLEMGETFSRLVSLVGQVSEQMGEDVADHSAFCSAISELSADLADQPAAGPVSSLVQRILAETQVIVEKSTAMAERLGEASAEINELRSNLEQVRQEAITDALTGIANRKHFDACLRAAASHATETGEQLSLIICDIDHFKRFNDSFGHRIGDEVLKVAARVIKDNVKGQDIPARYGGEEFCVILPNTELTDAAKVADQIRTRLSSRALTNKKSGANYGTITLSLGVAKLRLGEPLDRLIQRADEALYRAKRNGRNRVELEDSEVPLSLTG